MIRPSYFAVALVAAVAVAGACGSSGSHSTSGNPDASTATDSGGPSLIGGGDGAAQGTLAITPLAPTLTVVTGKPVPTQKFAATLSGHSVQPGWTIDRGELGAIDATGLLTPTGTLGGVAHVTAAYAGQKASTTVTIGLQTTQLGDPSWTSTPPDAR